MEVSSPRDALKAHSGERGIALILVLWVMVLVAVLAVGFADTARTDLRIVRNEYEISRARMAADAAVSLAVLGVLDKSPTTRWTADGRPYRLMFDGTAVHVTVQDEGGKIDLNAAPPELLSGLFQVLGVDSAQSSELVAAIVQRRQPEKVEFAPGSSDTELASAPQQRTGYVDISELRLTPGMTRHLYDLVLPFVTVYSHNARVDPITAPPEVLYAVPDIDHRQVEAFLAARTAPNAAPTEIVPMLRTGFRFIGHRPVQAATFRAKATTANKEVFVRVAVVTVAGKLGGQPYRVMEWDQGTDGVPLAQ